ncbi:unnamed protein product [Acanthoscelides obtectus]|uniref:Carboxylesterase type B domain-containing protein n=1 Tax=Acanthoscelides obtectus TaxID=200917 RepID=A0A9P0PL72_ACAOB|nr:unnamed protein product [Acanthoscelides obtectus]CAK1626302.1 Neurotactin [Acanthoscelides obtectus]
MSEAKSEDKKDIEVEEREKMLNAENKAQDEVRESEGVQADSEAEDKKITKDIKEGMEVKPKKIPIGGIQMPGFFTRSKSKERCKDDGDQNETEGTELLEKNNEKNESATSQTRIKLPIPFRKSKGEEDGNKSGEPKEKKTLIDSIRLPLVSVFPKRKKDDSLQSQTAQAELASMETLDEKSTDDKGAEEKNHEMKTVSLDEKHPDEEIQQPIDEDWIDLIRAHRKAIGAIILFIIVTAIIAAISFGGGQKVYSLPVKDGKYVVTVTSCGKVEGILDDGGIVFRGIPYARPPIGDLRFRYAQPLDNLDYCWNGTLLAHNSTPVCLQLTGDGQTVGEENCLTMDVVTPYVRYDNPLPVIVLIGADSFVGGSPGKMRPSPRYSRSKDVVFVRPNFRMGALGFLALEALSESDYPHSSGNYAISDILTALKWVKLNIVHFGGDPLSITVLGHKAGGTLVTAISTLHDAKEYFTRAWATSGGSVFPTKSLQESEMDNKGFMDAVQCQNTDCLRKMDARKLINAVEDTWRKPTLDLPEKGEQPSSMKHQWLVIDGRIIREAPEKVLTREDGLKVDLVIGSTTHTAASPKLLLKYVEWTPEIYKDHVNKSLLGERGLWFEACQMFPNQYQGISQLVSEVRVTCPLYLLTSQMRNVPFYIVDQRRADTSLADADSDIEAFFGRYDPLIAQQRRYSSSMQGFFYNFVWHGKLPDMSEGKVFIIRQDLQPKKDLDHCDFFKEQKIVPQYAALD